METPTANEGFRAYILSWWPDDEAAAYEKQLCVVMSVSIVVLLVGIAVAWHLFKDTLSAVYTQTETGDLNVNARGATKKASVTIRSPSHEVLETRKGPADNHTHQVRDNAFEPRHDTASVSSESVVTNGADATAEHALRSLGSMTGAEQSAALLKALQTNDPNDTTVDANGHRRSITRGTDVSSQQGSPPMQFEPVGHLRREASEASLTFLGDI